MGVTEGLHSKPKQTHASQPTREHMFQPNKITWKFATLLCSETNHIRIISYVYMKSMSLVAQMVKHFPAMQETWV